MSKQVLYGKMLLSAMEATTTAAEKIPEAKRMKQTQEGKAHPLWFIGHLANTNNLILQRWCCDGESLLSSDYRKMFAPESMGGNPIVADPGAYPSWDEVVAAYVKVNETSAAGLAALSPEELVGQLRGGAPEAMHERMGNVEKCILGMISHEAYHRGQMNLVAALD